MTQLHTITRRIEIDAGHRVPDHGSKCHSLHGHRYVIEATCEGPLAEEGEQTGMVLDFSFLKEVMVSEIHDPCDHAFIFSSHDMICRNMFIPLHGMGTVLDAVRDRGFSAYSREYQTGHFRYYVVPFTPTAENLARHWYHRMRLPVSALSDCRARLVSVRVHETPNCVAEYRG